MPVDWSDDIVLAELADEPELSEEFNSLQRRLEEAASFPNIVLNFSQVSYINSSHLAVLLRFRKLTAEAKRELLLCAVNEDVLSVMTLTGLEKLFSFAPDIATGLASLQLDVQDE